MKRSQTCQPSVFHHSNYILPSDTTELFTLNSQSILLNVTLVSYCGLRDDREQVVEIFFVLFFCFYLTVSRCLGREAPGHQQPPPKKKTKKKTKTNNQTNNETTFVFVRIILEIISVSSVVQRYRQFIIPTGSLTI